MIFDPAGGPTELPPGSPRTNHPDWKNFAGKQVRIQKDGCVIRTGQVKHVTVAGDALWLEARGVELRALFEKSEGYEILPHWGAG